MPSGWEFERGMNVVKEAWKARPGSRRGKLVTVSSVDARRDRSDSRVAFDDRRTALA